MSWETALLALVATETTIVGVLISLTYARVREDQRDAKKDIQRLDRARERHRMTLAELCALTPQMRHYQEFNRDD
jgi:hypothetical protein